MDIDWVQFLTDPVTLASALACVATFATVMTLAAPAFSNDKLTSRLKSVANRREELRKKSRAALEGGGEKKSIRVQDTSKMKKLVDVLDLPGFAALDSAGGDRLVGVAIWIARASRTRSRSPGQRPRS